MGLFDFFCDDLFLPSVPNAYLDLQGVSEGGTSPLRSWKILKFEIGIVQLDEYF